MPQPVPGLSPANNPSMCGIAGYFVKHPIASSRTLERLLAGVRHRGPDDEGISLIQRSRRAITHYRSDATVPSLASLPHYLDGAARTEHDLALVHARYAIIDLGARAHQPFLSADGTVLAVFHGEIYNYRELRTELGAKGVAFRTTGDTEVLVEGYRRWGDALWNRLNGFWAVALFDASDRSVALCRDRLGVAPLYYRQSEDGFFFGSSIRALLETGNAAATPDRERAADFVASGLKDFDERTFYHEVRSLPAATVVRFGLDAFALDAAQHTQYWRMPGRRLAESELPFGDAVEHYRTTLLSAVELRLRADVPVACELSGGLDSSSIVAAAATLGHRNIRAYTISVPESDEAPFARAMLERYPIDLRVIADPEDAFADDGRAFARIVEEPYHSPNIYTHYRMRCRMKSDGVAVVLSGSGGDEVLAGYESDFWPQAATELRAAGRRWHALAHEVIATSARPRSLRSARQIARALVHSLAPVSTHNGVVLPEGRDARTPTGSALASRYPTLPFHEQMRYHLGVANLPYYLRSNDHFSMAIPVEQRLPFLDYRLVELGLQLPVAYLFRNGWTKFILRKAMEGFLPARITWRREKMGFPFPLRRFLAVNRTRFAPLLADTSAAGLLTRDDYAALVRDEPLRLWRACSTGLWREAHAG